MPRVPGVPWKFDADLQRRFLLHFEQFGLFYQAAEAAGVCGQTVRKCIQEDEEFAERVEEARGKYRDRVEEEVRRRAMEGVLRHVTTGKGLIYIESDTEFETIQTSSGPVQRPKMVPLMERVYSDNLLLALARKHDPGFRDKQSVDVNHSGGVLLIPSGKSVEDWEAENARPAIPVQATVVKAE
jgi:hypothetical protein